MNINTDALLDDIYNHIDYLLVSKNFKLCDEILMSLDVQNKSIDILLGYLTITNQAKSLLKFRSFFYTKVKQHLKQMNFKDIDNLLYGLE